MLPWYKPLTESYQRLAFRKSITLTSMGLKNQQGMAWLGLHFGRRITTVKTRVPPPHPPPTSSYKSWFIMKDALPHPISLILPELPGLSKVTIKGWPFQPRLHQFSQIPLMSSVCDLVKVTRSFENSNKKDTFSPQNRSWETYTEQTEPMCTQCWGLKETRIRPYIQTEL